MNPDQSALPELSALELAALASAALKETQIRGYRPPLVTNADGQTLTVTDTDGTAWLVWAPSKPVSEESFARHVEVLRLLSEAANSGRLPFTVSLPEGVATRGGTGVVLAHPHPGGASLKEDALVGRSLLASSLGGALGSLHELDAASFAHATRAKATPTQTREAYRKLVEKHSTSIPSRLRRRWMAAIDDDALWAFDATPLHGNLSVDSVYASSEGAVLGLCHFTSAAVGDPAQDLAWLLYHADDDFLEAFQAAYSARRTSADLHILTRAQLVSELATLRWFARGKRADDRPWIEAGLKALRDLDAEIGDHWLVAPKPDVVDIRFTVEEEPLLKLKGRADKAGDAPDPSEDITGATEVINLQ